MAEVVDMVGQCWNYRKWVDVNLEKGENITLLTNFVNGLGTKVRVLNFIDIKLYYFHTTRGLTIINPYFIDIFLLVEP